MPDRIVAFAAPVVIVALASLVFVGVLRRGAGPEPGSAPVTSTTISSTTSTSTTTTTPSTTSSTGTTTPSTTSSTSTTTTIPAVQAAPPTPTTVAPSPATTAPATTVPSTTVPPPPSTTTIAPYADPGAANTLVSLVNSAREANGLPAVNHSSALAQASLDWARSMAASGSLVHSNLSRIGGFSWKAENLGSGSASAQVIHGLWMDSAGHRDNILSPKATAAGAGVWIDSNGTAWHVLVLGG